MPVLLGILQEYQTYFGEFLFLLFLDCCFGRARSHVLHASWLWLQTDSSIEFRRPRVTPLTSVVDDYPVNRSTTTKTTTTTVSGGSARVAAIAGATVAAVSSIAIVRVDQSRDRAIDQSFFCSVDRRVHWRQDSDGDDGDDAEYDESMWSPHILFIIVRVDQSRDRAIDQSFFLLS